MNLDPGIYPDVAFADYMRIEALNNSYLKKFYGKTDAHVYWESTHPDEDKPAFRIGDACHVAVLEPGRFERDYVRSPKFDRRTTKGKAAAAEWELKHQDKMSLLPAEYDMASAMRDSAWNDPNAVDLLKGKGRNEQTVIWKDADSGELCKGRMDRFADWHGWSVVIDIKTAQCIDDYAFGKAIQDFRYHQQAAFYLDGLDALALHTRRFFIIALEKKPPYLVKTFEIDDSAINEGRAHYREAIGRHVSCTETRVWAGYLPGVHPIDIPRWGYQLTSAPQNI